MRSQLLTLAGLASVALAQSDNRTLAEALGSEPQLSNLTSYTSFFPSILTNLEGLTDITLLAPSNEAFSLALNSTDGAPSSNELVSAIFSYHVINGTYSNFSSMPNFLETLLQPGEYANVTGGQVLEVIGTEDAIDGNVTFYSGLFQNASIIPTTSNDTNSTEMTYAIPFVGGVIYVINSFLNIPTSLTDTAVQFDLRSAVGALQVAGISAVLDGMTDVTCFIPDNEAFQAVGGTLATSTIEDLTRILEYHVVNGSVMYSTMLENGTTLTAMNNINLDISMEGEDIFVNSARVITPNVLVANGVIHVVDNVLNPGNRTAMPAASQSTQAPAFSDAASATDQPFTSGVSSATTSINTEGPSIAASSASAVESGSSSGGAVPRQTGAVAAAALFGGAAAAFMNL